MSNPLFTMLSAEEVGGLGLSRPLAEAVPVATIAVTTVAIAGIGLSRPLAIVIPMATIAIATIAVAGLSLPLAIPMVTTVAVASVASTSIPTIAVARLSSHGGNENHKGNKTLHGCDCSELLNYAA